MPKSSNVRRSVAALPVTTVLLLAFAIAGCSKKVEKTEDIRPVRTITVAPAGTQAVTELSGEVVPRYESRIGFRVGGKIIARKVDVGSMVKRGQVLMQLDPSDLQLSQAQAKAAVASAESSLTLARADLERYRELHAKNFVSQAVLDELQAGLGRVPFIRIDGGVRTTAVQGSGGGVNFLPSSSPQLIFCF